MPIYEYVCGKDGAVIELLRPMSEADEPVKDPEGKGRVFKRKHSTFATQGGGGAKVDLMSRQGGTCGCGKRTGGCGHH
jgi:putative FmdB family regulatory protein